MQLDEFQSLVEKAEELLQLGFRTEAKEIIEMLINNTANILDAELQSYIRVLCSELKMDDSSFDLEEVRSILIDAQEYCNYIEENELKAELTVCIGMDFCKMYLDKQLYIEAENYIIDTLEKSIKFGEKNYINGSVHNYALFLQEICLIECNHRDFSVHGKLINRIITCLDCEIDKSDMVIFFIKMAEMSFVTGDIKHGSLVFKRAFELERQDSNKCEIIYLYLLKYGYFIHNYIEKDILTEIILFTTKSVIGYVDNILGFDSEKDVYQASKEISGILRIFIAYVYLGSIDCDEITYFEVIANLKNIYSYILRTRNERKKGLITNVEWMPFDELVRRIPEDTIYIDYTQFPVILRKESILGDLAFSCLSLKKNNGDIVVIRHEPVYLLKERFLHLFLNATTRSDEEYFSAILNGDYSINSNLYDLLIKNILLSHESDIGKIYFNPDVELCSIPFSILMDEKKRFLIDRYDIAYIDSFRNFKGEYACSEKDRTNSLIVANPRYSVELSIRDEYENKYLRPLPLSKVEAEIVSDILNVPPITKEKATKFVLNDKNCNVLHIATHGELMDIDESEEGKVFPLSRCNMYFSGVNDFAITGREVNGMGDGVLTAEELLSYDLNNIKLCVLSVCFSGDGQVDYSQGLIGFRTVFMANGARAMISSLWEVDDFASAVFFSKFYKLIFELKPAEALRKCQLYLKNVTIRELRDDQWFEKKKIRKLGLVASHMEEIANMPGDTRLFKRPKYWAGFILTIQ